VLDDLGITRIESEGSFVAGIRILAVPATSSVVSPWTVFVPGTSRKGFVFGSTEYPVDQLPLTFVVGHVGLVVSAPSRQVEHLGTLAVVENPPRLEQEPDRDALGLLATPKPPVEPPGLDELPDPSHGSRTNVRSNASSALAFESVAVRTLLTGRGPFAKLSWKAPVSPTRLKIV